MWLGSLAGGANGEFDPATAEFTAGKIYDFPRTTDGCAVQYCNIEGIHFLSNSMGGAEEPGTLVSSE